MRGSTAAEILARGYSFLKMMKSKDLDLDLDLDLDFDFMVDYIPRDTLPEGRGW
jgi:hypothetical protein